MPAAHAPGWFRAMTRLAKEGTITLSPFFARPRVGLDQNPTRGPDVGQVQSASSSIEIGQSIDPYHWDGGHPLGQASRLAACLLALTSERNKKPSSLVFCPRSLPSPWTGLARIAGTMSRQIDQDQDQRTAQSRIQNEEGTCTRGNPSAACMQEERKGLWSEGGGSATTPARPAEGASLLLGFVRPLDIASALSQ